MYHGLKLHACIIYNPHDYNEHMAIGYRCTVYLYDGLGGAGDSPERDTHEMVGLQGRWVGVRAAHHHTARVLQSKVKLGNTVGTECGQCSPDELLHLLRIYTAR